MNNYLYAVYSSKTVNIIMFQVVWEHRPIDHVNVVHLVTCINSRILTIITYINFDKFKCKMHTSRK